MPMDSRGGMVETPRAEPTPMASHGPGGGSMDSHGGRDMLPKPTEKTRVAIVSEASTATLVFEVGLSVAGKGGCPGGPILGGFGRFKVGFWVVFCRFWRFFAFFGVLRYTMAIVSNFQ